MSKIKIVKDIGQSCWWESIAIRAIIKRIHMTPATDVDGFLFPSILFVLIQSMEESCKDAEHVDFWPLIALTEENNSISLMQVVIYAEIKRLRCEIIELVYSDCLNFQMIWVLLSRSLLIGRNIVSSLHCHQFVNSPMLVIIEKWSFPPNVNQWQYQ